MRRSLKAIPLAALLCLPPLGVPAQDAPEPYVIPLGVHNQEAEVVLGLGRDQLEIKGVDADLDLSLDTGPRRIVLLVDMSASMGRLEQWPHALAFLQAFIARAADEDEISLHVFSERHVILVPLTREREVLLAGLGSLPKPGTQEAREALGVRSQFNDAVLASIRQPLGFGGVVVLVGDYIGEDPSRARSKQVSESLARRGIRLMHVNVEKPQPRSVARELWRVNVRENLRSTGGGYYRIWQSVAGAPAPPELFWLGEPDVTADVSYLHIKYVYRLELRLRGPLTKTRKFKLSVADRDVRREHKPELFYPTRLYPQETND